MKIKHFSTQFEYFTPKLLIIHLGRSLYLHLDYAALFHSLYLNKGYELSLCKILYQLIWILQIFSPFLAIFAQNFYYFTQKKLILRPILLRIMAKIVS